MNKITSNTIPIVFSRKSAKSKVAAEILDIYNECSSEDWDCYGAEPVQWETVEQAFKFLELLPEDYLMPEICADPDGDICLEWYGAKGWIFSVSFIEDGIMVYVTSFGNEKLKSGNSILDSSIPLVILESIKIIEKSND